MPIGTLGGTVRSLAVLIQAGGGQGQGAPISPDSGPIGAHQQVALDSTVIARRVADPVIGMVQWIFQRPPWVMWGGAILAGIVAAFVVWRAWRHRAAIRHWLATRSADVTTALVAAVLGALLIAAFLGHRSYEFVMRDNRFCTGCHIFVGSGEAWVRPDTGYYSLVPRLEGKHDTLSCHDCHELKPLKEAVKMVYWMSGVRDTSIPPHAKVPRAVCARCHIQGEAKKTWQAVAATAGHRTHLESDSSALKGKVECLTCHARTAHRFQPANATCAQSGCHADVKIRLGRMSRQTDMHCVSCHKFTATVPALATRDSAARTLSPNIQQCLSCHPMQRLAGDFEPKHDPHQAQCGLCHNPHTQTRPEQAIKTCTTAGCHDGWRQVPFHTGAIHRRVGNDPAKCETCHVPHRARVDASDCTGCHESVRTRARQGGASGGGGRVAPGVHPPVPFDTTKALTLTSSLGARTPRLWPVSFRRTAHLWPERDPPAAAAAVAPADSFSHPRHRKLPCITCHDVASRTRRLTFEPPRGCQICHHQAPAKSECRTCHEAQELAVPRPLEVHIAAAGKPARPRTVGFAHETHRELRCVECHTTPVTLAPAAPAIECRGCHDQHHTARASCATCHHTDELVAAHRRPVNAHEGCDACHAEATVARLVPTRPLCLTCHQPQANHFPARECATCHFQRSPTEFQEHLRSRRGT